MTLKLTTKRVTFTTNTMLSAKWYMLHCHKTKRL